jgi:hypothetical protein
MPSGVEPALGDDSTHDGLDRAVQLRSKAREWMTREFAQRLYDICAAPEPPLEPRVEPMYHRGIKARTQHLHEEPLHPVLIPSDAWPQWRWTTAGQQRCCAFWHRRHSQLLSQHVSRTERKNPECDGGARNATCYLCDGAVSTGGHYQGYATHRGLSR